MKIKQKLSTIFTLFVYITSLFLSVAHAVPTVFANDTSAVTLEIKTLDANGRLEYLTGEKISSEITLGYSGDPIEGTSIFRIKVKKDNVSVRSPKDLFKSMRYTSADSTSGEEIPGVPALWTVSTEGEYYISEYEFTNYANNSEKIPVVFSWNQGTTPNGHTTDIVVEFERPGHPVYRKEITYTAKIQPAKLYHTVERMSGNSSARSFLDGKSVMESGVSYPNGVQLPDNTPDDTTTWARYVVGLDSSSNAYGNYTPQTATITYKLPAGARMRGNNTYNGAGKDFTWSYDAGSHTATYTGPLSDSKTAYIELDFPNQPYATIHTSAASMVTDTGTVNQFNYDAIEEHVKWTPSNVQVTPPPPGGSNSLSLYKTIRRPLTTYRDRAGIAWNPSQASSFIADAPWQVGPMGAMHATRSFFNADIDPANPQHSYVTEIVEKEIDPRLYFWRYTLEYGDGAYTDIRDQLRKGWKLYGTKASGEEVLIHEILPRANATEFYADINDKAGQYVKLRLVFNEPIQHGNVNHRYWHGVMWTVYTPVKDEIWKNWTVDELGYWSDSIPQGSERRMYASASAKHYWQGKPTEIHSQEGNEAHRGNQPLRVSTFYYAERTHLASWHGDDHVVTEVGTDDDAFYVKGDVDVLSPRNASRLDVKNTKLISLLPEGLEFVPGSESNGYAGKAIIEHDYRGTGRTAVIIPLGDIVWNEATQGNDQETSGSWHANKVERYVEFKVKPNDYLEVGDTYIEQYVTWDNNEDVLLNQGSGFKTDYVDALDLDNDKDTSEKFIGGTIKVTYNPPIRVGLRKQISVDKTNWFSKSSSLLDIDTPFFYKLILSNYLPTPVTQASIIDVLPVVGDKRIVANDAGNYGNRGSVFAVSLTGDLATLPENADFITKWDILYSTDSQGATTDATVNATFVPASSITDWSAVKMVKFDLKAGQTLLGSEKAVVIIPAKVPVRNDLSLFDKANNTAAFQTEAIDEKYREGSVVSAPVARYAVTGVAFHDIDKDGQKDRNEPVLSGYTVQLMNEADNSPVLDPVTGQEVTAVTNAQGVYKLDVFKRGQYYIKVVKKEAIETFTRLYEEGGQQKSGTSSVKDGVIGNDTENIDDTAGRTVAFDLNPSVIPAGLEGQTKAQQANTLATEDNTLLAVRNIGFENVNVKLDIKVNKVWEDANNQDGKRPSTIKVNLLANGTKVDTATISDNAGTWSHTFTEKPKYENGREITYTVEEETVTGYTPAVTGTVADGFTITNSYTPEVVDVLAKKVWNDADNQDGKRPADLAIVVTKTVDGVTSDTAHTTTLTGAGNEWTHTFTGLPKYEAGKLITYGVKEVTVPAGYTSRVTGTTITNSYTPETTEVSVKKEWNDANNQDGKRPSSITIKLLADNDEYQEKVIRESDNWAHTFSNLPKFKNGREIVYTVAEVTVTGYTSTTAGDAAAGFTITNSYTPELVNVPVRKVWDDADNQDGKRPASITVNLLADGVEVQEKVVTEAESWAYTFSNLPKFNSGRQIVYTITEDDVTDYTPTIEDTGAGFTITNKHVPEVLTIEGKKTWDDADDQDGKRPGSITVNLLADGVEVDQVEVDADADWKYAFKDVPKYKDGQVITYTITEDEVEAYTTTINGFDITNSYTPEVLTITGEKIWKDEADQDGIRPEAITVNLLANGEKVADVKVTADANDNWTYEFKDVPKFAKGKKIVYTVTEDAVEGYTTTIDGTTITNTHKPAQTTLKVVKVWKDDNNKAQKRPDSITIQLVADGKEVKGKTLVLNAANNWQADFTDLDKNKNGQAIVYTVKEVTVPEGYTSTVDIKDGVATITNTYTAKTPLPKTGETASFLGFLGCILLGLVFFFRKRFEA